ncbi:hypothetical protein V5O48_009401 [Marasmius crinis-equi]|uniref:F-box domain-containing protein n=1 Tax=Marasmius crinis-equi TaxID=585013 RepID=A0ABR3FBX9_9AGAR
MVSEDPRSEDNSLVEVIGPSARAVETGGGKSAFAFRLGRESSSEQDVETQIRALQTRANRALYALRLPFLVWEIIFLDLEIADMLALALTCSGLFELLMSTVLYQVLDWRNPATTNANLHFWFRVPPIFLPAESTRRLAPKDSFWYYSSFAEITKTLIIRDDGKGPLGVDRDFSSMFHVMPHMRNLRHIIIQSTLFPIFDFFKISEELLALSELTIIDVIFDMNIYSVLPPVHRRLFHKSISLFIRGSYQLLLQHSEFGVVAIIRLLASPSITSLDVDMHVLFAVYTFLEDRGDDRWPWQVWLTWERRSVLLPNLKHFIYNVVPELKLRAEVIVGPRERSARRDLIGFVQNLYPDVRSLTVRGSLPMPKDGVGPRESLLFLSRFTGPLHLANHYLGEGNHIHKLEVISWITDGNRLLAELRGCPPSRATRILHLPLIYPSTGVLSTLHKTFPCVEKLYLKFGFKLFLKAEIIGVIPRLLSAFPRLTVLHLTSDTLSPDFEPNDLLSLANVLGKQCHGLAELRFVPRQLYYQLLLNLRDFFLPHLDLVTLARVSRTSLAAYRCVLDYERVRHNFDDDLARFFPLDAQHLLWRTMLESGCIISGSFVLQLLKNQVFAMSDLDMYCILGKFWIVVDFLLLINYTYFAEGDQPIDLQDLRGWIEELADRRWEYPYGIVTVINFMRETEDGACVMNFLGPGFLISLFPKTTLGASATIVNQQRCPDTMGLPLIKYQNRGFAVLSAPPVSEACMTHSEFDPCRAVGDPPTLLIQLEGPRVQQFLLDNWDKCKQWLGKTCANGFNVVMDRRQMFKIDAILGFNCDFHGAYTASQECEALWDHNIDPMGVCGTCSNRSRAEHDYFVEVHRKTRVNVYTTSNPIDQVLLVVLRKALSLEAFSKENADSRDRPQPPDGAMAMAIFRRLRTLFYALRWKPRVYIPDMYPDFEDSLLAFEPRQSLRNEMKKYAVRFSVHLWQTPWRIDPALLHTLTVTPHFGPPCSVLWKKVQHMQRMIATRVDAAFSALAEKYPDSAGARRPSSQGRVLLVDNLTKIFKTMDIDIKLEFDVHHWEAITGDLKLTVKVLLPERPHWLFISSWFTKWL